MAGRERIAVTGIGIVSALGIGARTCFSALVAGERGIRRVSLFDTQGLRSRIAAEVPAFDPGTVAPGLSLSRTDALALVAAREALAQAGWSAPEPGLALSVGGTAGAMLETEAELLERGANDRSPQRGMRLLSRPLSHTVNSLEAALGPLCRSATICSACSSGAVAIVQGAHWVATGHARAVLAGGADALCRMTFAGFNALAAVDPEPCRPFDSTRAGLTLGEGAAFLLLEAESNVRGRGGSVLAWLSGWAVGAEAHHSTHPEPSGRRAASLMRAALDSAELSVAELDYVNAHGTATLQNDAMEALALCEALGPEASRVCLSSTKGQLGHALGAAGAIEAAISVLALENGLAPATVGLSCPAEPALNHVMGASRHMPLRTAMSNSFGFGGLNAVLVFEAAVASRRSARPSVPALVVTAATSFGKASDPSVQLDPDRSRRFDRTTSVVTGGAQTVLQAAALDAEAVGLVVGNAYGSVDRSLQFLDRILFKAPGRAPPAEFPHLVQSSGAGHASVYLGMRGPVLSVSDGALGAEAALGSAISLLELRVARAIVTGAVQDDDAVVRALAPVPKHCARREGGGFLVIEDAAHAAERGCLPLARLLQHIEERGLSCEGDRALMAPQHAARAVLVLGASDATLLSRLSGSAWASVACIDVPSRSGFHEAIGAVALETGVAHIQRGAEDVLVLSGGSTRRSFTRLGSPLGPP